MKEETAIQYRAKKGDKIDELIAQFLSETSGVYMYDIKKKFLKFIF